jgi:predicted glycosyltransferase
VGKRIVFYSHNGFGLGHVRRNYLLARAVHEADPSLEILLITGSPFPHEPAPSEGIDYVRLPSLLRVESNHWRPKQFPGIGTADFCDMRSDIILSTVRRFRPDVLIADHLPQGVSGELIPALEWLRDHGSHALAGFRDILDAPEKVARAWSADDTTSVLDNYYSKVLVYGSSDVFDFANYGLNGSLEPKLTYCGYLGRQHPPESSVDVARSELRGNRERSILACAGGGADGLDVLQASVQAGPALEEALRAHMVAVAGPLMPEPDWKQLETIAGSLGIELRGRIETFTPYVAAADLMIGMCGYNTVCESLSFGVPLVSIPRRYPSGEQAIRAEAFARLGLLTYVEQEELEEDSLVQAASESVSQRRPDDLPFSMNGVEQARDEIMAML